MPHLPAVNQLHLGQKDLTSRDHTCRITGRRQARAGHDNDLCVAGRIGLSSCTDVATLPGAANLPADAGPVEPEACHLCGDVVLRGDRLLVETAANGGQQQRARQQQCSSQVRRFLFLIGPAGPKWDTGHDPDLVQPVGEQQVRQLVGDVAGSACRVRSGSTTTTLLPSMSNVQAENANAWTRSRSCSRAASISSSAAITRMPRSFFFGCVGMILGPLRRTRGFRGWPWSVGSLTEGLLYGGRPPMRLLGRRAERRSRREGGAAARPVHRLSAISAR